MRTWPVLLLKPGMRDYLGRPWLSTGLLLLCVPCVILVTVPNSHPQMQIQVVCTVVLCPPNPQAPTRPPPPARPTLLLVVVQIRQSPYGCWPTT